MKYTGNYNLKKPEGTDIVNVEDFNNNADIIDQKLKEIEDKTNNAPADSVNDDAIGTRTPDQSKAPSSPGTGKLTDVLSWLANRIKAIMGSTNWWDTPPVTLQTTKNHIDAKDNPHSVTKSQVGLGNVQNYGIATQSEVEAGTSNSKYMTPLRTMQAIAALSPVKSVNDKTGQVTITPADIGAETPAGAQAKAEAAAGAVQAELNTHKAERATETKLGHVKAKTKKDGTLMLLLSPETAALYGLTGEDATVDGALKVISYNVTLLPKKGLPLEEYSWEQVDMISRAGAAPDFWAVGDTKNISVNGVNYTAQIIGFSHDDLATGGKAGITFQLQHCMATTAQFNPTATNIGGWKDSAIRTDTIATLYNQVETGLKNIIKPVNKLTSVGGGSGTIETVSDKLFLLSEVEVFGVLTYSYPGEGSQYDYYSAGNSKVKNVASTPKAWWLRSPRTNGTTYACWVSTTGTAGGGDAHNSLGVSFGFCV